MGSLLQPAIKAGVSIYAGRAGKKGGKSESGQLRRRAGATRATGQRTAAEDRREARYVMSAARAKAAAGGGALSDPTVVNLLADIEARGEYNALVSLWESEEEALGLEAEGIGRRREGRATEILGYSRAIASLMDDAKSFGGG